MIHSNAAKTIAIILSIAILLCGMSFCISSDDTSAETNEPKTIASLSELLSVSRYNIYTLRYKDVPDATDEVSIDAVKFSPEYTTAAIGSGKDEVHTEIYDGEEGVFCPEEGAVGWTFNIPKTGMYSMEVEYYPVLGKSTSIERTVYIDGAVPFYEARYIPFTKVWSERVVSGEDIIVDEYGFQTDITGNEIKPEKYQSPKWRKESCTDETGYYVDPFKFYLTEGQHTLQLEGQKESMAIKTIRFYPYKQEISYEEYYAKYSSKAVSSDRIKEMNEAESEGKDHSKFIKIEGEKTTNTSELSIYPIYDRTSPISSPQSASKILLNTIGGEKWEGNGQWASWTVTVPEDGLYKIALRYKQDVNDGLMASRLLRINGEIPFAEAKELSFPFGETWQSRYLTDGKEGHEDGFMFYLNKGENTIELQAVFGQMTDIINRLNTAITTISNSYIKILMITGATPDVNRDYYFYKLIPAAIDDLLDMSVEINSIADELISISGVSSNASTLQTVARVLEKMGKKEDEVAKNMGTLKNHIGTLGTWLQDAMNQPLEIDYFHVTGADGGNGEKPQESATGLQALWFEVTQFAVSFVADYNTLGDVKQIDNDHAVVVWTSSGRDQANIIRNLINNNFTTQKGINVSLKLVAGGSLLPSILAGVGPDVALDGAEVINWAIREAILPLDEFEGFDELVKEFPSVATVPLTLYKDDIEGYSFAEHGPITPDEVTAHVYGLPVTMAFNMLFYRADIFQSMGLAVPRTWDDFYAIIPILQNNHMDVAFPQDFYMFLYQSLPEGTPNYDGVYADDGRRINFDSNLALTAFDRLCSLFTRYSLPVSYDFINRFRTGEMPMGIISYASYTQLSVFAPEIKGLWEMIPVPGTIVTREDGTTYVNNNSICTVSAITMPRGNRSEEKTRSAWEFMRWYVGHENQSNYANEYAATLGSGTKYETANMIALAELPWSTNEYKNIMSQFQNLSAVAEFPGGYIITRYINFAFMNCYNNLTNPVETMLNYITEINKEISRKRKEFGYDYYNIDYSTSFTESEDKK